MKKLALRSVETVLAEVSVIKLISKINLEYEKDKSLLRNNVHYRKNTERLSYREET